MSANASLDNKSFLDIIGLTRLWELVKSYIDVNHPKFEIVGDTDSPDIDIDTPDFPGGGGGNVVIENIDTEMSDESDNPVANRVIKAYVEDYVDSYIPREFSSEFSNDFTN